MVTPRMVTLLWASLTLAVFEGGTMASLPVGMAIVSPASNPSISRPPAAAQTLTFALLRSSSADAVMLCALAMLAGVSSFLTTYAASSGPMNDPTAPASTCSYDL